MKSSSSDLSDRDTAAAVEELSGRIIGELHLEDGNEGGDIDWERTAGLAQRCADSLRSGPARTMWAQGQLIPVCGQLLQIGLGTPAALPCMTQCCRVIGNIVLDHPANRTKCRVADVPQRVYRFLQAVLAAAPPCSLASDQVLALKAATGALLNLTIDTPDIRRILLDAKVADGISGMLSVHRVGVWPMQTDTLARATIVEWATKLLQELLAGEERLSTTVAKNLSGAILALPLPGTPDFDRSSGLSASLPADATRTLLAADLSIMRAATEILESIAYKDEAFQELLAFPPSSSSATADQSLLDQMLDFVEHADLLPAWLPLAQEDAERAAAKGQQMQSRRQEDEEDDDEGEVLDVEKSVSTVKAEVARIVIAVSSNDRVMHAAFEAVSGARTGASALLPRCTAWIRSGRTDLIITGSTMLANLARKESYCVQLAHDHALAEPLAVLLQAYSASPPPPTTRSGEATQVLHGITGLIKNLAIPGANKQLLSDAGVIEPCLALLRPTLDMVVPLQNASIGILKHLCAGNVASALKVVLPAVAPGQTNVISLSPANANANGGAASGNGPLDVVLDLIARTSDVRLKSEATRLLVNVIRSLYSARSIASPVTPSALGGLETGIAKSRARAILEKSDKMAEAISEMLRTGEKYPVLVNEAIVALTLLSTTEPGATVTLQAVTTVHETLHSPPPMTGAAGLPAAAGDPSSPAQPGGRPRPLPRRTNGFTSNTQLSPSTPNSRAPSLMTRSAPPSALDILIRWLTEYSITAANMPAELAGNALALLEGMIRSPPLAQEDNAAARKRLRLNECKAVVRGVVGRKPELPAEEALQHAAKRALGVLEALA